MKRIAMRATTRVSTVGHYSAGKLGDAAGAPTASGARSSTSLVICHSPSTTSTTTIASTIGHKSEPGRFDAGTPRDEDASDTPATYAHDRAVVTAEPTST